MNVVHIPQLPAAKSRLTSALAPTSIFYLYLRHNYQYISKFQWF